ncbi:MlaD family protein [Mycobacterium sp. CVI_P3]|uniref:MlaD family protein n=1 Tax=Mycobacterium pinniadriaticum TaxID=2994102 RepID=A0ABT3SGW1_9MYCO|nr:MlaD family protein [Mycobacterium pinniadriaticum]MCX2931785.1 MlaD family protein [Mycobacterium pinniadriaticum]MCX2938140.1 MlaD family protein [Mycobacterium pinniadriaticum]
MYMTRRIRIQLAIFLVVSLITLTVIALGYLKLPQLLFGVGQYTVTVELPEAGGLYQRANVTYRGSEVGEVKDVNLTDSGVVAVLSLRSDVKIPSNLTAAVHSTSAVGEQYVALLPRTSDAPPLKDGDVIPRTDTRVPPDINSLLDATNRGLEAIPRDDLKTAVDESYTAFGGLGPELSRLVRGSTTLASDARKHLSELTNLVDNSAPLLQSQIDTSDEVQAWAARVADISRQLKDQDPAVRGILEQGAPTAEAGRALIRRLQPTLPILLANLVSVGEVGVAYRDGIEQILVLLPQGAADVQATALPDRDTNLPYKGGFLSFNLNFNVPPPCTTGFLPAQQWRSAAFQDSPDRPEGDLYCRVPQDSVFNVRGARNTPCATRSGKRAPTVKMCESDENYVPLNDGLNWKGDPNATSTGQTIPQPPPGTPGSTAIPPPAPAEPPVAIAEYDPATGSYVGPDGNTYTQGNLAQNAPTNPTWQDMLLPPSN